MHRAPSILPNKWPENPMPNHTIVLAVRGLVLDFSTNKMDRGSKCAARVRGTRVAAPHLADEIGGTGTFADSVLAKVGGKIGAPARFSSPPLPSTATTTAMVEVPVSLQSGGMVRFCCAPAGARASMSLRHGHGSAISGSHTRLPQSSVAQC